jgi:enediyne biosynthesis protein E4
MSTLRAAIAAVLVASLLAACASEDTPSECAPGEVGPCRCVEASETCDAGSRCDALAGACVPSLADRCTAGTEWTPGTPLFRDASAEWGLTALGVEGQRISVGDIDGDGYPDLAIRRAGGGADDFSPGGTRFNWLLRNTGAGTFEDVTRSSGFASTRHGEDPDLGRPMEVVVFADVTGDGHLDVFTGWGGGGESGETSEILLGDGSGNFVLGPEDNPLRRPGEQHNIAGAAFVDVSRGGLVDLWIGHGAVNGVPQQDRLFRGDGTGRFHDHTAGLGLITEAWSTVDVLNAGEAHSNAWGVTACDLDGNGTPDLLAASYGRAPNHLFTGEADASGGVRYTNASVSSGYAFDHRQDWSDNESARCWCMHNPEDAGCADVPEPAYIRCNGPEDAFRWNHLRDREPFRLGGNSSTTLCADLSGDGRLDLFTTEIVHWDVGRSSDPSEILFNTGEVPLRFERPGPDALGLVRPETVPWDHGDMSAVVFDADNSGRLDILLGSADYPGTRAWLFMQQADGTFEPVPFAEGIDHRSSHGAVAADFDRNGALDLVLGHSRNRCAGADHCYETAAVRLFENVLAHEGNWFQLDLVGGPGTNRSAIGARATVRFGEGVLVQEVGGGHGHYGAQNDRILHFGLGSECEAEVTIRWPDAALTEQRFTVQTGYRYRVVQGEVPLPLAE